MYKNIYYRFALSSSKKTCHLIHFVHLPINGFSRSARVFRFHVFTRDPIAIAVGKPWFIVFGLEAYQLGVVFSTSLPFGTAKCARARANKVDDLCFASYDTFFGGFLTPTALGSFCRCGILGKKCYFNLGQITYRNVYNEVWEGLIGI